MENKKRNKSVDIDENEDEYEKERFLLVKDNFFFLLILDLEEKTIKIEIL